jgi:hypothetical protein
LRASSRMTLDEKSLEIAANCSDAGLIISASSHTTFHLDTIDFTPLYPFWQEQMDPPFPRFKTPNAGNQHSTRTLPNLPLPGRTQNGPRNVGLGEGSPSRVLGSLTKSGPLNQTRWSPATASHRSLVCGGGAALGGKGSDAGLA